MLSAKAILTIRKYLNKRYGLKIGRQLNTFNDQIDHDLFDYLNQAFQYELHLDTFNVNKQEYLNKLKILSNKLKLGYQNPIVCLLKMELFLKQIATDFNYESDIFDQDFVDVIKVYQHTLNAPATGHLTCLELKTLFSDFKVNNTAKSDDLTLQLAKFLNYYISNFLTNTQINLVRLDGDPSNYQDYQKPILAQLQNENHLAVNLDTNNLPIHQDKESIIWPIQEALYLKGFIDNIPQNDCDHDLLIQAINNFQKALNHPITQILSPIEMQLLFSNQTLLVTNSLLIKQKLQAKLNNKLYWNTNNTLDSIVINNKGIYPVELQAAIKLDFKDNFANLKQGLNQDKTVLKLMINNNQIINTNQDLALTNSLTSLSNLNITQGFLIIKLKTDFEYFNTFKYSFNFVINSINNLPCSKPITISISLISKLNQILNLMQANSKLSQTIYSDAAIGQFTNNYGLHTNQTLDLTVFNYLESNVFAKNKIDWNKSDYQLISNPACDIINLVMLNLLKSI